jgi:hypothetical protein
MVALGRIRSQQLAIDFDGVFRPRGRDETEVRADEAEAASFQVGFFPRHKYAPRPGHERTPAWARRLDIAVREIARQQLSGN